MATPENNGDLIFPGESACHGIEPQHPDPVQTFRLWQIFLDRVNPMTKVIHVPTLQPYIIEATTNPSQIPWQHQALLFAIYLMATLSLSDTECHQLLGSSQALALQRFSSATRAALLRFDYLRNYDMAALQALLLYMVSLSVLAGCRMPDARGADLKRFPCKDAMIATLRGCSAAQSSGSHRRWVIIAMAKC
jgi:hypothetical protein